MRHCRGGDGPNSFDVLAALESWFETGKAPEQIVASHSSSGNVDRARPLGAYSMVARYKSTGRIRRRGQLRLPYAVSINA